MYARIVRGSLLPDSMDHFMRVWQDSVLPALQSAPGVQDVYVLKHSDDLTLTIMVLWESKAAAEANQSGWGMLPIPTEVQVQLSHYRSEPSRSEICEVLLHA